MVNFDIKVVTDTICPWCFVGKRRLEKAIELYKEANPESTVTFTTSFYPFYVDPTAPKDGIDKMENYHNKYGPERTELMVIAAYGAVSTRHRPSPSLLSQLIDVLASQPGHTRESHRLIQLAKTKGLDMQKKVIEELNVGYFEHERDITSQEFLKEAGVKAGLDGAEIDEWMQSGKGGDAVDREVRDAYAKFITGVPNFTINDKYRLQGAQEASTFVRVFERIAQAQASGDVGSSKGPSC